MKRTLIMLSSHAAINNNKIDNAKKLVIKTGNKIIKKLDSVDNIDIGYDGDGLYGNPLITFLFLHIIASLKLKNKDVRGIICQNVDYSDIDGSELKNKEKLRELFNYYGFKNVNDTILNTLIDVEYKNIIYTGDKDAKYQNVYVLRENNNVNKLTNNNKKVTRSKYIKKLVKDVKSSNIVKYSIKNNSILSIYPVEYGANTYKINDYDYTLFINNNEPEQNIVFINKTALKDTDFKNDLIRLGYFEPYGGYVKKNGELKPLGSTSAWHQYINDNNKSYNNIYYVGVWDENIKELNEHSNITNLSKVYFESKIDTSLSFVETTSKNGGGKKKSQKRKLRNSKKRTKRIFRTIS